MEKEQQVLPNRQEIKALIDSEQRAYSSLVDFRKEFIPSKDDVEPAPFHQEWSNILLNGKENFAIEAFRESAKTQIVIRANLLHALTYAVPHRSFLVIICATQTRAGQLLQSVSREFLANKDMNGMVAEIKDNSDHALQVYYTDRSVVRIEAYGKGASVRGLSWGAKRPDLVIIDDPQGEEDARSETITENDWNWFLSDIFFLGQNTRIFLIGNNLGERCIIEQVIKNAQYLNFTTRRIPILNEDNKSAWPSKYSLEYILKDKENWSKVGKTDIWYRERMCQCISPDSQKFKKEYFKYYDVEPELSEMNIYTTVDLAISQKVNADYSAIVTVGVNSAGHWFVLDVEYGRYDPTTTIDAIFSAVKKWRPLCVGIEVVAYQAALQHFLEKEMPRRGIFFRIQPLRAEKKKEIRIDSLQPRFAVGTVWFRREAVWLEKLESELLAYPNGAHDDVIDALAYIEQMASAPYEYEGRLNDDWNPIAGSM
ncbi:MAG: phage terminase large subunit [Synergistaceae bacterium]|nr:phage terminase large subunit [Synergistaceae bacterium]